jgi:hypothetical protein
LTRFHNTNTVASLAEVINIEECLHIPALTTAFTSNKQQATSSIMAVYWPSILLFMAGGLIGLYCNCRRRKQRREMEEFREREVRRRQQQEQLQHAQFILNFPGLVGVERLRQERLAHLLVSGVSNYSFCGYT